MISTSLESKISVKQDGCKTAFSSSKRMRNKFYSGLRHDETFVSGVVVTLGASRCKKRICKTAK